MRRRTHATCSLAMALGSLLLSCATSSSQCEQRLSACIERCEAVTNQRGLARSALPPQNTARECETRCSCPRTPTTPKPQGPPTPTGYTQ